MLNYSRGRIFFLRHLYGCHHKHVKLDNVTQQAPESLRAVKSKILIKNRALNLILCLPITLLKGPKIFTAILLGKTYHWIK